MLNYLLPFFGGVPPAPPVIVVPGTTTITLAPANPGNLGLTPGIWTTHVTTTGGLTQVKWMVGIPGAKTIQFARTSNAVSVPNYNHGDVINFTGYGTGFTLTKDSSGANRFIAAGSSGNTSFNIGSETLASSVRFTVDGAGGTGPLEYIILNLTNGQADIQATFYRPGDMLIVKSIDEVTGVTTAGVTFGGAGTKSITLTPHDPGNLVTAPANWTTRINAVGLDQVKWNVFDANWTGSGTVIPPTTTGLVRGRPIIQGGNIKSEIGTTLRGITMALDGPGRESTNYTLNRSKWQMVRDLKFNLVRLPFSVAYEGNSLNTMLPLMDQVVANASATGMYVMFMLDGAYGNADWNEINSVWPVVAARFKNNTNVFFEMGNEWHWSAAEYNSGELDSIANLYNMVHAAAPDTFIGLLTPASVDETTATVNAMNGVRSRVGVSNFNKAVLTYHGYSGGAYNIGMVEQIKNAYPSIMTETTGDVEPQWVIPPIDALGVAWCVLALRWGVVVNTTSPDTEPFLRNTLIPDWRNSGFDWPQDSLTGGGGGPVVVPSTFNVVNLVNNTTQVTGTFTAAGDKLVVQSIDGTIQDISGPVSFNAVTPPPGGTRTLSMNPLNPGNLGTAPATWQTLVTATGMTSFEWVIRDVNGNSISNWAVANLVNGQATLRPTFTAAGQTLIISTPDNAVRQTSGAVSFGGVANPPPPTTASSFNLLLRGQSNAFMFADGGGFAALKDALQSTLSTTIGMQGEDAQTIFSGTGFMDWPADGEQQTFMNYVAAWSSQEKSKPCITLWLHNENDQQFNNPTTAQWVAAVRSDAALFRSTLGQQPKTTPYVFVPIRFPYGDRTQIVAGMTNLAADTAFNAVLTQAATESDILMNGGPEAGNNSSHMSAADTLRLAPKLVGPVIEAYNRVGAVVVPPVVGGNDYQFANDFVKNLTMGVNLERGAAWGSNTAYFNKLKTDGSITHLKIYVSTRPEWGSYVDDAGINVLGDTIQNAIAAGLKCFIGFTDVLPFSDLNSQSMRDYIDNAARIIASRNIDPRFLAVGPWGEMAEWTNNNTPYNGLRKFYQDKLRSIFPNHNIITAGASWSAWEAMVDPTMEVYADKRTIYEWHSYPYDAKNSQTYANIQTEIDNWKNAKGVVTYCGELAGDGAPDSPIPGDRGVDPANMPPMITAVSRGCWRERPAIWTITDQGYYRLNNDGNHDFRPEIASAFREANTYIRSRPGFGT